MVDENSEAAKRNRLRIILTMIAREMKRCRICCQSDGGPLTLDFGGEYAHTTCIEAVERHGQKMPLPRHAGPLQRVPAK